MVKPKLTVKEAKLVKGIAEGKTKRQAAFEAYDVKKIETASVMASEALKKPSVQAALEAAFKKHGIDIDSAIAPIGKALKAKKIEIHGKGEDAFAEEVEDVELQLKGSDRALKLMGVGQTSEVNLTYIQVSNQERANYDL